MLKKLSWYVFITMIIVALIFVFSLYKSQAEEESFGSEAAPIVVDLIGTQTGTSTVGVGFRITSTGGQSATTTYPYMIGNETDSAIYTLKAKNASSTANLQFSLLGSNDIECDTATTTTIYETTITTGQINWFDIGDHLNNKVHSTSLAVGTSTLIWSNPVAGTGRELILSDLNYNCIALQVSGSSTVLWSQLETKKFR